MNDKKTNKIIATATVAIALSAAMQAISAFGNFNVTSKWDIVALAIMGLMLVFIVRLAMYSWFYLKER